MAQVALEVDAFPLVQGDHVAPFDGNLEPTQQHVDEFLAVMLIGAVAANAWFDVPALAVHHVTARGQLLDSEPCTKGWLHRAALRVGHDFADGMTGLWRHEFRQRDAKVFC